MRNQVNLSSSLLNSLEYPANGVSRFPICLFLCYFPIWVMFVRAKAMLQQNCSLDHVLP